MSDEDMEFILDDDGGADPSAPSGSATPGLSPALQRTIAQAQRYDFYTLVDRVQRQLGPRPAIGGAGPAAQECLRLHASLGFGFPGREVASAQLREHASSGLPYLELRQPFLGILGPGSPLPAYYTEDYLDEDEPGEGLVRGFLDLFNHRLASLLFRVHAKYQTHIGYVADGQDRSSRQLLQLLGLEQWPEDSPLPALCLVGHAGILTQNPVSAAVIEALLDALLPGVAVVVEECSLRRIPIPPSDRLRLGQHHHRLGTTAVLGETVRDRASSFTIHLGPVDRQTLHALLPGHADYRVLVETLRLLNHDCLHAHVAIAVSDAEMDPFVLGDARNQLGWTTRLGRRAEPYLIVLAIADARPSSAAAATSSGGARVRLGNRRAPSAPRSTSAISP